MDLLTRLDPFSLPDALALGGLVLVWLGIGWVIEHPPAWRLSVSVLMAEYQRDWLRQFVTRNPRIYDATVLDTLRQGTAFFASACMITLGGGIALLGNVDRLAGLAGDFSLPTASVVLEIKVIVVLALLANALLKFIWAHRLFGYCAVLMSAVPNDPDHPECHPRAAQAAEISITAVRGFNRGLRSIYFALAALCWLLGAVPLVVGTVLAGATLARREFASQSRQAILLGRA